MSIHGLAIMNDDPPPGTPRKFDHPPGQIFGEDLCQRHRVDDASAMVSMILTEIEPRIFFMLSA
jgi:hypothetical protein